MNKIVLFVMSALIFNLGEAFAQDIEATSEIASVLVYSDSALIDRVAVLKLTPGPKSIIFADIIPEVDEDSLSVSGKGTAEVKIFGAKLKKEFLEEAPSEKIKQLQDQIQVLEDEVSSQQNLKDALSEEKKFLDSIRLFSKEQIPKDLVTKTPKVEELDNLLKFLDTKLKENYSRVMEADLKIRDLQKKIDVLRRELAQLRPVGRKLKRSIVVELEVLKPGTLDLTISYLVKGASWKPIYDARASFEKGEVELVSYGLVKQTTGEDWSDVELSLSTAKPAIGGRMPYIAPWFLRPYRPEVWERRRRAALDKIYQYEAFAPRAAPGAPVAELPEELVPEVEFAKAEERGAAIVYELPRKATIRPDGSEHKLPIFAQDLKTNFEYSTCPRLSPFAYLGCRVTNSKDLQLLPGRVNLFLGGDYVGASSIDMIGPGEEFDLYLGVDEAVKVKREEIERKIDETFMAGIPGRTKRTTLKYKLTVENYKAKKIKVNLFDSVPVSQDERIKVKLIDVSEEPKEKDWKDRKGVWKWELELEPKGKKELYNTFSVDHPRTLPVEGL